MKKSDFLTVGELLDTLNTLLRQGSVDEDSVIILSADSEGNCYSGVGSYSACSVVVSDYLETYKGEMVGNAVIIFPSTILGVYEFYEDPTEVYKPRLK